MDLSTYRGSVQGRDLRGTGCAPLSIDFVKTAEQEAAEKFWREKAGAEGLVCVKREGGAWVGVRGEEPTGYLDWLRKAKAGDLGSGGRGHLLIDSFDESVPTFNLWVVGYVPAEYVYLFESTHETVRIMDAKAEAAFWKAGEFSEEGV